MRIAEVHVRSVDNMEVEDAAQHAWDQAPAKVRAQ